MRLTCDCHGYSPYTSLNKDISTLFLFCKFCKLTYRVSKGQKGQGLKEKELIIHFDYMVKMLYCFNRIFLFLMIQNDSSLLDS